MSILSWLCPEPIETVSDAVSWGQKQIAENLLLFKGSLIFLVIALVVIIVLQVVILRKMHRNSGGNILSGFLLAAALVFGGVANAPVAVADDYSDFGSAIRQGDVEQVKHYINAGLDVDMDINGWLPLEYAIYGNQVEVAKILIAAGANLELEGKDGGGSLLFKAVKSSVTSRLNVSMIKILLAAGANPHANASGYSMTPIDYAKAQLEAARDLISKGYSSTAMPFVKRAEPMISLMESYTPDPQYVANLRREHCEWLQDVRCEDDTPDETAAVATEKPVATADDYEAFGYAIREGDVEQVKHYINAGLDLDKGLVFSLSSVQQAALHNSSEILKMLLAAGANPNATGIAYSGTALALAIDYGHSDIAEILQNASDPQYISTLRREHCEWLRDVRCEDDTPEETAAVATEETDYGVLYGSVAWRETPTHIHWYWVLNAADEGEANTDVGNYCDADVGNTTDCKLAGAFNNGCGAIAVSDEDIVFYATEASTFSARRAAIGFCDKNGGTKCKAVDSVCTADVEDKEAAAKAKQEKETGSVAK